MSEKVEGKNFAEAEAENQLKIPEFVKNGLKEVTAGFTEVFQSTQESSLLMAEMLKDEKVKTALLAAMRTLLNVGISVADAFPGVGEVVSTVADVAKLTPLDLSPDVSKFVAWGSEALELFTAGAMPSHAIETTWQFVKDVPRMKAGLERAKEIWQAHQQVVKSEKVQHAATVFAPTMMPA